MEPIENLAVHLIKTQSLFFLVELVDSRAATPAEPWRQSIVVRIQLEDVGFNFGATRPKSGTAEFPAILAQNQAAFGHQGNRAASNG